MLLLSSITPKNTLKFLKKKNFKRGSTEESLSCAIFSRCGQMS